MRVPVFYGHAEAVHLETREKIGVDSVRRLLEQAAASPTLPARARRVGLQYGGQCAVRVALERLQERPDHAGVAEEAMLDMASHDPETFFRVLCERVEPALAAASTPVFLVRYPRPFASRARLDPDDPRYAERFELYVCGVELANGFGELTDAEEQRRRFETWMADKARIYGERYPIDEDFLSALAAMPPASGCALGFDRLVMLASGAERIEQVIWTPLPDSGT